MSLVNKELAIINDKTIKLQVDNLNSKQTTKINLIFGDSFIEMKKIKNEAIDFIFIDPPYFYQIMDIVLTLAKEHLLIKANEIEVKAFLKIINFIKNELKNVKEY